MTGRSPEPERVHAQSRGHAGPISRRTRNPERGTRNPEIWGSGIGRRRPGPDFRAVIGSVGFHVVLVGGLIVSGAVFASELPEFEVYRVRLVSPPPQEEGEPEPVPPSAEVVRPTEPEPVEPIREVPQSVRPVEETPEEPVEEPPPEPEPARGADPEPDSPGGEDLDVDIEGQDFPYPEYLQNIILQLNRYFRWAGNANLTGTVAFAIERDGSVSPGSMRVVQKSGDWNFDLEMMSAVEQAGNRGAFNPLPDGWVQDKLWVRFRFLPPG
ncbi:MAG: TonB C-terminal domain-containing protein [Longimicrobiales bacterium]